MKIDRHISNLLHDHDCVIVPEMGGFVASYSPARINVVQQVVEPPFKKIAFNVFLTHNDGLLAEYISRNENLGYNEALMEIRGYVYNYHEEIDAGKKFVIEQVGILYADVERNVQFEPFKSINYLKGTFGLATVHAAPLEKELKKSVSLFENRESVPFNRKPETATVQSRQRRIENQKLKRTNTANTLLLVGSIFWFLLNIYFVAPTKMDFASLNPFSHRSSPIASPPNPLFKGEGEGRSQAPAVRVETVYVKPAEPIIKDTIQPSMVPSSENIKSNKPQVEYYIVAGAFRFLKNAAILENELRQQGFPDAKIIDSASSLKMVSFSTYSSLDAAVAELNRLKAEKRDVWIYRR